MVRRRYECWKDSDGVTFTTEENAIESRQQGLISQAAVMEYAIEEEKIIALNAR